MQFFGIVFIITTTLILVYKHEKSTDNWHEDSENSHKEALTFKDTYKLVWKILNIGCVKKLAFIIFTSKVF